MAVMRVGVVAVDGCGGDDYGGNAETSSGGGYGFWWWQCSGGGKTYVSRTRNSKDLEATTSTRHEDADTNSTMQILKRKYAKAQTVSGKRSNSNIFGFFVDSRYEDAI
jgi:hypothetical protein